MRISPCQGCDRFPVLTTRAHSISRVLKVVDRFFRSGFERRDHTRKTSGTISAGKKYLPYQPFSESYSQELRSQRAPEIAVIRRQALRKWCPGGS